MKKIILAVLFAFSGVAYGSDVLYGINEVGTKVGQRQPCANGLFCGIIKKDGVTTEYPSAGETNYLDIDSGGNRVGYAMSGGKMLATLNGANVGPLNVQWSRAWRINDAGQILWHGYVKTGLRTYTYKECLLANGVCTYLPKQSSGGYSATYTFAMNGYGHTGGEYYLAAQDKGFGFISANGVTTTIEYPGSVKTTITGLNDLGEASGMACMIASRDYWVAGATCLEAIGFKWSNGSFTLTGGLPYDLNNSGNVSGE